MNPEHDPPNPEVRRPVQWSWDDHPDHGRVVRIPMGRSDGAAHYLPWAAAALEALEETGTFDAIVDRIHAHDTDAFPRDRARRTAGKFLFSLYMEGYVHLPYDPPAEVLGTRYEVEDELGRGAVGVVWRCRDRETGAEVAVKHGWGYFLDPSQADEHVRHEADVLEQLDHPGVPRLLDRFEARDRFHLVRDLVEGDPLEERGGRPDEAARLAAGVADVLEHLHDRGFLLLDVTPANFVVGDRPVLVDPGHCRAMEEGEVELEAAVGSPGFRAPEVLEEKRSVPATDVDGLGRLLFHLVAGRRPPRRTGPEGLRDRLQDETVADVVEAFCRPDPAARPSLAEARARLEALAEKEGSGTPG